MYYAKVNWYDQYADEDKINHMIICASDWNDAMQKINKCFSYINSIEMRQIEYENSGVIYIQEEMLEDIIKENSY